MEFKGTKGKLELKYISGVCIGIGAIGNYSEITANSIIPDDGNKKDMERMESDMLLYSKPPEMLGFLHKVVSIKSPVFTIEDLQDRARKLIKSATELKEE